MRSWKLIVFAGVLSSTLFAQVKIEKSVGKVVLKDKESAPLEITEDSKFMVEIAPARELNKLILGDQFQVKIISDKQEVIFYSTTFLNKTQKRINYFSEKVANNQDFALQCYVIQKPKQTNLVLQYEKGYTECIKTNGCKSYTLDADKKFKYGDTTLCIGKKEIEVSKTEVELEEVINCLLMDEKEEKDRKNWVKFSFTNSALGLKENPVKPAASECK